MCYHVMLNDNVNNELESPKQSKSQALATELACWKGLVTRLWKQRMVMKQLLK